MVKFITTTLIVAAVLVAGCDPSSPVHVIDVGDASDASVDGGPDACSAESLNDFCGHVGCGRVSATDNCGTLREVDCPPCPPKN